MINANKEYLQSFFTGNLRYVVPFFQRSYVWDQENWEPLWDQLTDLLAGSADDEHFIGTIITKERPSERIGEKRVDLIDGQQRLTTIAVLLKAIADKSSGKGEFEGLKKIVNDLVVFNDSRNRSIIRMEHSRLDAPYFNYLMLDQKTNITNAEHLMIQCYQFFSGRIENFNDAQLDNLQQTILNRIPVISMLLNKDDDEQEIFDTINSLGVKLTTGELLKNHLFHDDSMKPYYESH